MQEFNKLEQLLNAIGDNKNISVFGVPFYSRQIILSKIDQIPQTNAHQVNQAKSNSTQIPPSKIGQADNSHNKIIYVCTDINSCKKAQAQFISLNKNAIYLPPLDDTLCCIKQSIDNNLTRLKAINQIATLNSGVVITTVAGFMQLFPTKSQIVAHTTTLNINDEIAPEALINQLIKSGYKRVSQIDEVGQVAIRGGIVDISPINLILSYKDESNQNATNQNTTSNTSDATNHNAISNTSNAINQNDAITTQAIRLDFFGETIERIRLMDFSTQQGQADLKSATIPPAVEVFLPTDTATTDSATTNSANSAATNSANSATATTTTTTTTTADIKSTLKQSINKKLSGQEKERAEEIISQALLSIESKIPDRSLNFIKPLLNQQRLEEFFPATIVFDEAKRCVDAFNAHLDEHKNRFQTLLMRGECFNFGLNQLRDTLCTNAQMITFDRFLSQNRIFRPHKAIGFDDSELIEYPADKKILIADINDWIKKGYKIIAPNNPVAKELFKGLNVTYSGQIQHGAKFNATKTVYIGLHEIAHKNPPKTQPSKSKKSTFFQPKINDYVVHPTHGIGLCEGIERIKMGESERDYAIIRYEEGKLYLACENLNMISAYAGEETPKLSKIGGAEFARAKEKAKKAIQEMAFDLAKLYATRQSQTGYKYNPDNYNMSEFEADFPYEETPCQTTAIKECMADLTSGKVMDRLLCGDVGYGKTEVAMRLMYKVVLEGKQGAFVSPTTVLSRQHFASLNKRMGKFGVKIASLTRFDSPQSIKDTLEGLKRGTVDIVCGTHRALSKDVVFRDLGILVLDEEQRFGVSDKEKIKLLKTDVNVLSLSATPIPRTLHMSMSGIRDISVLDTPPRNRMEVSTYVSPYTDALVFDAITREINRGGQAFIVYNRVETIDAYALQIAKMFPDLKIKIAHGQMEKRVLEGAINDFMEGNAHILIASTIIENGIDMANVNTMIVVDSDKLGLGQMYQLRGRIGRSNRQAYAYFTFDGKKILTENALKRLDAITSYTSFGSGFKLAMADLEIRGAGNVLGAQQHGHIQKIGYDMYLKLIGEVMDELKGEKTVESKEVKVSIDFDAFIPEDYIPDIQWRLKAYRAISDLESEADAINEVARLKDIYGGVPLSLKNLILVSTIKNLAGRQNAERVTITRSKCEIKFPQKSQPGLELIKKATQIGFFYSLADSTISIKPKTDTNIRLLKLLDSLSNPT